jgi:serine/threonine-protein kinase ATR
MQLLRDNKDSLMSVLEAYVHDPLVEWEDEKRKKVYIITISMLSPA